MDHHHHKHQFFWDPDSRRLDSRRTNIWSVCGTVWKCVNLRHAGTNEETPGANRKEFKPHPRWTGLKAGAHQREWSCQGIARERETPPRGMRAELCMSALWAACTALSRRLHACLTLPWLEFNCLHATLNEVLMGSVER